MKTWYCEEDERPIPEGEAVEIRHRDADGNVGSEVICVAHAIKRGYREVDIDEGWIASIDGTEYKMERL